MALQQNSKCPKICSWFITV